MPALSALGSFTCLWSARTVAHTWDGRTAHPFAKEYAMTALRQRMLEDMPIRNLAPATQRADVEHVSRFARHFGRSPALLGPEEIRASLVDLTTEKQLAPSTIIVAVAARRVLDTVTLPKPWSVAAVIPAPQQPQTLPVILSPADVVQLLDAVTAQPHRTLGPMPAAARHDLTGDVRVRGDVTARLPRPTRSPHGHLLASLPGVS